jgi:hypothetical protein
MRSYIKLAVLSIATFTISPAFSASLPVGFKGRPGLPDQRNFYPRMNPGVDVSHTTDASPRKPTLSIDIPSNLETHAGGSPPPYPHNAPPPKDHYDAYYNVFKDANTKSLPPSPLPHGRPKFPDSFMYFSPGSGHFTAASAAPASAHDPTSAPASAHDPVHAPASAPQPRPHPHTVLATSISE